MSAPVIDLAGLTKLYGPTIGIRDLTLSIGPGEVFGFLGPNGAGKTTTIRLLLDLIRPTGGSARLFGMPSGNPAARARTGYLPGDLRLDPRLTAEQTMDFFARLRRAPRAASRSSRREEICARLGLGDEDRRRLVR
ncbi:MAG TPA: ATP-binding cassette domain-containing protein, partial [Candidatus Saccharimonadales bacterium]|nr:ATP-binding cassette domain-containing protein [Candidatus Saccharimonadales bacterium]